MKSWIEFPPIPLTLPALALAAGEKTLWAGGMGGVARYDGNWRLIGADIPLSTVTVLAWADRLYAGGPEGIAWSRDAGNRWMPAYISGDSQPVTGLLTSPGYSSDLSLLASTWGGGVLRSSDAGQTWKPANFGLQSYHVLGLAWRGDDVVLAASNDGLYRSPNGGRAWKSVAGSEGQEYNAVAFLSDGSAVAAAGSGALWRSTDAGVTWAPYQPAGWLPGTPVLTLAADRRGGLYLSDETGTIYLRDQVRSVLASEPAQAFAQDGEQTFIALADSVLAVNDNRSKRLPAPPLQDVRRVFTSRCTLYTAGLHAGLLAFDGEDWQEIDQAPTPLTLAAAAPDGALLISSPEGLMRSEDGGQTWETCLAGVEGMVAYLTFRQDGAGWAVNADGSRLLHSPDGGRTWRSQPSPFGALPPAALQAAEGALMAAAYDARRTAIQLFYSHDDGATWLRGAEIQSAGPVMASCRNPAILAAGQLLYIYQPDGVWKQVRLSDESGRVLRLACDGKTLLVLTTTHLLRSDDLGQTWIQVGALPCDTAILDVAVSEDRMYILFSAGRLWAHPL